VLFVSSLVGGCGAPDPCSGVSLRDGTEHDPHRTRYILHAIDQRTPAVSQTLLALFFIGLVLAILR
jgi:hypothetical protein